METLVCIGIAMQFISHEMSPRMRFVWAACWIAFAATHLGSDILSKF